MKPRNIRWGPADGGWQEPPIDIGESIAAWTIEAANPYFVHLYCYDPESAEWQYQGMALEQSLEGWTPEGCE